METLANSKTTKSTTSNECKICNGIGWILDRETNVAKKCECYNEIIQDNMLRFAKIPSEFEGMTVNSFDVGLYTGEEREKAIIAKKFVAGYIKNFLEMQELGKGFYLYSRERGSGKTRLAVSAGNAIIKTYKQRVRFVTTLDLLGSIKETYNEDSKYTEQKLMSEYCEIPILILDDVGVEKAKPWVSEIFFKILDTRMTYKKVTIVTSNLAIDDLQHDERIKSRLSKMTISMQMPEQDIRGKLGQQENKDIINRLIGSGTE